jgi:hypothetical protein
MTKYISKTDWVWSKITTMVNNNELEGADRETMYSHFQW